MITTPLDSALLDSKEQYVFYHKMVDFVLKELIVSVQQEKLCTQQELLIFKQYSDLLLYSIEAMRIKYMYDEEDNMKVDLTDSGFPNYLEFRYLYNDLELRKEYVNKLTDTTSLKEQFLDTLLRKKEPIKRRDLYKASSIIYYTSVEKKYIFNRFVQGKIIEAPKNSLKTEEVKGEEPKNTIEKVESEITPITKEPKQENKKSKNKPECFKDFGKHNL